MEPHSSVDATITDRHGNSETVYAGSLPTWAAKDPEAFGPWKKVRRTMLLEDRTTDPSGWKVRFTVTDEEPAADDD